MSSQLPLHLPLEVLLHLPLGAEYKMLKDDESADPPRNINSTLCCFLICMSSTVRNVFKHAIRACL
jgi:hypothetical protein